MKRANPSPRARGPKLGGMKTRCTSLSIALAACSFELTTPGADNMLDIQLTPAGAFKPRDGRVMEVPAWYIDAATAQQVIAAFSARRTPPVVDYEHQTLRSETNGQPAPAAAWMRALQWRDSGLWATVELTARAADLIQGGEYLYVSPVFRYDPITGHVLAVEMAAFTNNPAIDDMAPLARRAAATFGFQIPEEDTPMKLLAALVAALSLAPETTEDQAIAACAALKPRLDTLDQLTTVLGVREGEDAGRAAIAACSALKASATNTPDPAKYVPLAAFDEVKGQVAALSAQITGSKVNALVEEGLADGRLLPAQKDWAISLGTSNLAALSAYMDSTPAIAALSGTQTGGRQPAAVQDANGLTAAELAVCSATGIDPKDFAASKPQA